MRETGRDGEKTKMEESERRRKINGDRDSERKREGRRKKEKGNIKLHSHRG